MTTELRPRVAVLWLRRDLRVHDHPALARALASADVVVPLYVLDERLLDGPRASANRTWFLLGSLRALADDLARLGSPLVVRTGRPEAVVPAFAAELGAVDVFATRDIGPFARRRDRIVDEALAAGGRRLHLARGLLVAEPEEVGGADGRPVLVFTPFFRRWAAVPRRAILPAPAVIPGPAVPVAGEVIPVPPPPTADDDLLPLPGEAAARTRLARWVASAALPEYADGRNRLDAEGTSRLSADLKFGTLSPLEVLEATEGPGDGRRLFLSELAWREFYAHVLWHFPHVVRGAFRPAYDAVSWPTTRPASTAWRGGRTGFPVVDAAMRQLAGSGWMHNRARMIAASFLTKDLLVDWRAGERPLHAPSRRRRRRLQQRRLAVDRGDRHRRRPVLPRLQPGEPGPKVRPRRRVRPALGAGARRTSPTTFVHEPWMMPADVQAASGCVIGRDYPAPIVDHAAARARALAAYAAAKS